MKRREYSRADGLWFSPKYRITSNITSIIQFPNSCESRSWPTRIATEDASNSLVILEPQARSLY